jgi:hypothetical protein
MLAVFDAAFAPGPRISGGMTMTKLDRWGVEPLPYRDLDGLRQIAASWLEA